jgi:hypothetical protein
METFEPSREQERVEHLQHLLKRATQEALPIELETKVLNIDAAEYKNYLPQMESRRLLGLPKNQKIVVYTGHLYILTIHIMTRPLLSSLL